MSSPDLPRPVSLALHNVTETQLVDAMVAALQINVPDWIPQEGATEVLLMESLALVQGQYIYALNQLPRVTLDGLIALRGYQRKPAVPASGVLTVTLASSTLGTRLLPAGARFRIPHEGGTFDALVDQDTSINPADNLSAVVAVTAADAGSGPNGTPPGVPAVMVDAHTWIETALVSTAFGGGGDLESDDEFYARVALLFQSQSTTLVTDNQFAAAALAVPGVGRAKGYGLWDGVGAVGTMTGHVSVAVAGPDGANVSAAVKAAVLTELTAGAVAGLVVHVIDFVHVAMNLTVVATALPGYDPDALEVEIETVLRAWLDPATWPYTETLTAENQIVLRIGQVAGVDNVVSATGWSLITGGNTLPSLGTVTVTVT